jgi:uncharacterized protein
MLSFLFPYPPPRSFLLLLFFFLDLAFLMLTCEHYAADNGHEGTATRLKKAGGLFGFLAAFLAWYHALAGIHESR